MPAKKSLFSMLIIVVLATASCTNASDKTLSKKEMTSFLVDLHQLDGALAAQGMGVAADSTNVYYYNALLKKHAITKAQFDSTLAYYARNPKKFERIYSTVIEELTAMDEKVKAGFFHPVDSAKLRKSMEKIWPLTAQRYVFTKDSINNKLRFVVKNRPLAWNDRYTLSFLHRVGKSDIANNKQAIIRIHYSHSITDSIVCKTNSDSLLRRYTIRIKAGRQLSIDSITGSLINYKPAKGKFNALIDSIQLIRNFDALAQDSIRKVIQQLENPPAPTVLQNQTLRLRSKILLQRKNETPE